MSMPDPSQVTPGAPASPLPPAVVEFVNRLLDDWEADEDLIFQDRGTGPYDRMEALFAARRAEWAALNGGDAGAQDVSSGVAGQV